MQITPAPHHIPAGAFMGHPGHSGPSPLDGARQNLTLHVHLAIDARRAYVAARIALGHANRRHARCGLPANSYGPKSVALAALARCRRDCERAERAEDQARAELAAFLAPAPALRLAA